GVLASTSAAHAAAEVRRKALAVAADHLEAAPEDLMLEDGRITVRGTPGRGLTLGDVAAIATAPRPGYALPGGMDPGLEASDYALPRAADVPRLEVHHVVTPSPLNPLGVKGAGEGGTLPAPAAIANAVADALRPLGVEITEMPLTRERLWRRLQAAETRQR